MTKFKKKAKKPARVSNEKFGREEAVPIRDIVERLLQTPPGKKR